MATDLRLIGQRSSNASVITEVGNIVSSDDLTEELSRGLPHQQEELLMSVGINNSLNDTNTASINLQTDISTVWDNHSKNDSVIIFNNMESLTVRKSERSCKKRSLFPEEKINNYVHMKKRKRKIKRPVLQQQKGTIAADRALNGEPFCCDRCKSPYICNPARRANQAKRTNHAPCPRHKIDPLTNKVLTLCNACGLAFSRLKKVRKEKSIPSVEEKEKYLTEAKTFATTLVEGLQDNDAERLACPHYKTKACACIQRYIVSDGQIEDSRKRASELLNLLKEAKRLSRLKSYNIDEVKTSGHKKRVKNVGLGNGQKKSKLFEQFVLENRKYLREEVKLCERAAQRVLMYSNNFLHKKLKTDPQRGPRIDRQKGKAALGLLKPVSELIKEQCCVDNCIMMVFTHSRLLQQWRNRAITGQSEARRVLAEMLTPSGGVRSNCYKFISMITGCSNSTISRVNEQMKRTGGEREPPQHGLKKWWREHPKNKSNENQQVSTENQSSSQEESSLISQFDTNLESQEQNMTGGNHPDLQQQQVLQLQQRIVQQQFQIAQQQQQLLQHQILQQNLLQQMVNSNSASPIVQQMLQSLLHQQSQKPNSDKTISCLNQMTSPESMVAGNKNLSLSLTSNKDSTLGTQSIFQNIIVDLTQPIDAQSNPSTINLNASTIPQASIVPLCGDYTSPVNQNLNIALLKQQLTTGHTSQDISTSTTRLVNETNISTLGYAVLIQQGASEASVVNIQPSITNSNTVVPSLNSDATSSSCTLSTDHILSQPNSQDLTTHISISNDTNRTESFLSPDALQIYSVKREIATFSNV